MGARRRRIGGRTGSRFDDMENSSDKRLLYLSECVLSCIHTGKLRQLLALCTPDVLMKYDQRCGFLRNSGEGMALSAACETKITWSQTPSVRHLSFGGAIVAGTYYAQPPGSPTGPCPYLDYTILFFGGKAAYIQLAHMAPPGRRHMISAVNRDVYCLYESEILYLEVFQNHLHWHLRGGLVESLGTLSGIAQGLSEDFIRVHRCYIVNKNHVESVRRLGAKSCALTMDNGDVIPIPYDKFVSCREKLASPPLSAAVTPD